MTTPFRGPERAETLGKRILRARLELSVRGYEKVTQGRLGQLVAEQLKREQPITAATVSRWESDESAPDLQTLEALASVCGVDPGWLGFGEKSGAPRPWDNMTGVRLIKHEGDVIAAQLSMDREELIAEAVASDRKRNAELRRELQSLLGDNSKAALRRSREIMREFDSVSHLERLTQSLFRDEDEHERRLEDDPEYRRRWYGDEDEEPEDEELEDESAEDEAGDDGGKS